MPRRDTEAKELGLFSLKRRELSAVCRMGSCKAGVCKASTGTWEAVQCPTRLRKGAISLGHKRGTKAGQLRRDSSDNK